MMPITDPFYSSLHQNLITKAPSANLPAMLVAQLLPFAKNLSARKFSDEDILEDVHFLRDELTTNFQSLTWVHLFILFGTPINLLIHCHYGSFFALGHTTSTVRSGPLGTCRGRLYMNRWISGRRMQQS